MAKHRIICDIQYYHKCSKENCDAYRKVCTPEDLESETCMADSGVCLDADSVDEDGESNRKFFHLLLDEFIDNVINKETINSKDCITFQVCNIHKIEKEES